MTISAFVIMTAHSQALDWDTLSVNQNPIPAEATVSFSIGYPKGWMAIQNYSQEWQDIYFDVPTSSSNYDPLHVICSFSEPATNVLKHGFTSCTIFLSGGATAEKAAENFFNDKRSATAYTQKGLSPIKTNAGDSGWLVESKGSLSLFPFVMTNTSQIISFMKSKTPGDDVPVIYHDFFFHAGTKGAIRIQIMTQAANPAWREELDQLVLQTLRFN